MLQLDDSLYFSQGSTRKCYFHPSDPNLCIKVPLANEGKRTKGILKAVKRENAFYKILQKRKITWDHLSQYKGDIDTNVGKGSVYQLIRDENGGISTNLETYLKSSIYDSNVLCKELSKLYKYMQKSRILTTSLLPRNIVVKQRTKGIKLVIIDDIGSSELIPISSIISLFAEKKIKRKWDRMMKSINICHNASRI